MTVLKEHRADVEFLLERRHDHGADAWATPDGRWGEGSPFSTFDCVLVLCELGVARTDPVLKLAAEVLFDAWRPDGRFRPAPKATIHPCHTANAARALCRLGYARDRRLKRTFEHLLEVQHLDGGWRCSTVRLGVSPATDAANPGVTLNVLDAFRFTEHAAARGPLDRAVGTLLAHWKTRRPLGPCAFGIGARFGRIEYPFLRYNLFHYLYVLSFYPSARRRPEFLDALATFQAKLVGGKVVVEHPHRSLAQLSLCRRGEPSRPATKRYRELLRNLER